MKRLALIFVLLSVAGCSKAKTETIATSPNQVIAPNSHSTAPRVPPKAPLPAMIATDAKTPLPAMIAPSPTKERESQ